MLPFQRAMLFAGTEPAEVKDPPATRSPPGMTASAFTEPPIPAPSALQLLPFQAAILLALTPPA